MGRVIDMAEKTGKKKGGIIAVIAVMVVVIVALVVAVIFLLNKPESSGNLIEQEAEPAKRNVVVNEENIDQILENMAEEALVSPGNYEVTMNTVWDFSNGESASSNAYVENAVTNTNDVFFDVLLADTEETIFESPLLPIGSHIENITLDKNLEAGTYDCVMVYSLVDEDQKVLSNLQVGLTINVEN